MCSLSRLWVEDVSETQEHVAVQRQLLKTKRKLHRAPLLHQHTVLPCQEPDLLSIWEEEVAQLQLLLTPKLPKTENHTLQGTYIVHTLIYSLIILIYSPDVEVSSTTARSRRINTGGAVRPLRPGPRINIAGRGRGAATSTTTEAPAEEDHVTGDEEPQTGEEETPKVCIIDCPTKTWITMNFV